MLEWTGERYLPWFEGAELGYEHLHRYALAAQFVENKRVLDLACGEGYGSNLLARRAAQVVGIDIDEQTVKHATNRYIRPNLQFKIGSIMDVPIAGDGLFDVIVCFEALEHVADHERLLNETKRLLAADGIFLVSTPNKMLYTDEAEFNNPFHVHELYFDEFKAQLEHHFRQVKFLGQRIFCNSHIWSIFPEERTQPSEFVIERSSREFTFVDIEKCAPVYFVAVASDVIADLGGQMSVLLDLSNQLINHRDHAIDRLEAERNELTARASQLAAVQNELLKSKDRVSRLNDVVKQKEKLLLNHARHVEGLRAEFDKIVAERDQHISSLLQQAAMLDSIRSSHGWKVLTRYYKLRDLLLPEGSFRRNSAQELMRLLLAFRSVLRGKRYAVPAALESVHRPQLTSAIPEEVKASVPAPAAASRSTESELPAGNDTAEHYEALIERISQIRVRQIENVSAPRPEIISIAQADFVARARSLVFAPEDAPEVSIIIPVFNSVKFTLECLTSLLMYTSGISYDVIVVDDGSTDRTEELLSYATNVAYIRNPNNSGFVHTCNRGAQRARGKYLLFLNNDAQVTDNWLKPLVETFHTHQNVGAVGPKILFPDGRLQEAGALVNRDCTSRLIGCFDHPDRARYNYTREVMYCSGACLLVNTATFRELGGFATDLAPAYCEDWDLAFRLRQLGLRVMFNPQSTVVHHLSITANAIEPDFKIACVVRNQQKLAEKWQPQIDELNKIRLIAWYLPQFHPIPENDRWWGKGFTEWTNVAKARPNYAGHYQPHIPADLGFYDLRVSDVIAEQAELAKRYGLYGFCYYYYWFAGRRLLDRPLDHVLNTKASTNFCIAWANENWTRTWDGHEHNVLIGQEHSDDDDRAVIHDMMRYLRNDKYIRINGKPLLLVYRMSLFPGIQRTTDIWREECLREGIGDIYLVLTESFQIAGVPVDPLAFGFDASVEFPPHGMGAEVKPPALLNPNFTGTVHDYRETALKYVQCESPRFVRFRSVMPSWDNTPRRQDHAVTFEHASPGNYQAWLETILDQTHEQNFGEERIVFINAWNEWGEGDHLEPDRRYGHGFLEATRNAQDAFLLSREKAGVR
jgi:GT2 family glycosyltransferase/2-polyprenyl-3-methyl-5-hydroxy-6-metoxy-1,4-benzoquinol methylase